MPWNTKLSIGLRTRGANSRCCRSSGKMVDLGGSRARSPPLVQSHQERHRARVPGLDRIRPSDAHTAEGGRLGDQIGDRQTDVMEGMAIGWPLASNGAWRPKP
jgi:hypothetical protein